MVSEPSIPVVSCTEMTNSAAEEERCKELLGKLKEAIDRRGLMLDELGKVMNKMVSSLATSTTLLVSGATESTPISTATNKIPAVANAAPSADATLTDQAPTRCSTMCPDHGIDMPLSDCTTAVALTSSSTIATLEIGNTFIANTVLVKSTECSRECEVDEYASDDMEEGDAAQRGDNGVDNEGEHVEDGNMEPDKMEKQQLDNTESLVHPSQGIQPNHMEIDSNRESEANLANSTDMSSAVVPSVNFSSKEVPSLEISMPNSGDGSRLLSNSKPEMQTDAPPSHIKQTNPFRSIGDAMEEWKEWARVSADTQDHQPETEHQIDDVKQSFSEYGSHVGKVETDERTPGDDNLEVPHLQASQSRINKSKKANEFEGREIQPDTSVQDLVQGETDKTFGNVVSFKRPPADDKVVVLDDLTSDRELSTQMDLDITNEENKRAIVDWKSLELATIMAIGMWTLPPSPRWLLLREVQGKGSVEDNEKKAIYALRRLRGWSASDNVLADEIDDTIVSIKAAYAERQFEGNIWGIFEGVLVLKTEGNEFLAGNRTKILGVSHARMLLPVGDTKGYEFTGFHTLVLFHFEGKECFVAGALKPSNTRAQLKYNLFMEESGYKSTRCSTMERKIKTMGRLKECTRLRSSRLECVLSFSQMVNNKNLCILLEDLFEKQSQQPLIVWYPSAITAFLYRTELHEIYNLIGVQKISPGIFCWERENSRLFVLKFNESLSNTESIEDALFFAKETSRGLLCESTDQVVVLADLLKFGFLLDFVVPGVSRGGNDSSKWVGTYEPGNCQLYVDEGIAMSLHTTLMAEDSKFKSRRRCVGEDSAEYHLEQLCMMTDMLPMLLSKNMGLTSTAVKKGGLYSLDVSSVYKYKNTLVDVKVDIESNISTTLTVLEVLPSTKLVTEGQYFHENTTFATAVGMKPSPVVEFSGTVGAPGLAFGAFFLQQQKLLFMSSIEIKPWPPPMLKRIEVSRVA